VAATSVHGAFVQCRMLSYAGIVGAILEEHCAKIDSKAFQCNGCDVTLFFYSESNAENAVPHSGR